MEPLSSIVLLIGAAATAVNGVNRLVRLASSSKSVPSRLQTLRVRAATEKMKTDEWCSNVAMNGTKIDAKLMRKVDEIRQQLESAGKRVSKSLEKLQFDRSVALSRRLASAYVWENGGYEDAKDLVDLMSALNEALRTLVPPLPSYDGQHSTQPSAIQENPPSAPSTISSPGEILDPPREIQPLWRASATAMRVLGSQDQATDQAFTELVQRLRLWGSNVFADEGSNLDILLAPDNRAGARSYVLSLLIDIVVLQEHLLLRSTAHAPEPLRRRLEQCQATTRVALIGNSVTLPAIERWYNLQADENNDPKPIEVHVDYLVSLVGLLFDLLGSIRRLRQQDLLKLEKERTQPAGAQGAELFSEPALQYSSQSGDDNPVDTIALMENNLEKVRRIPLQSAVFDKSHAKLERWRQEASTRRRILDVSLETEEMRKLLEELASKLDNVLPAYDDKTAPMEKISSTDITEIEALLSAAASQAEYLNET